MKVTDNALNVLAAKSYKGIGRAWICKNIKAGEHVADVVALLNEHAKEDRPISVASFENRRTEINGRIHSQQPFMDGVTALGDPDFPAVRGNVKNSDHPVAMFYRGDLTLLNTANRNTAVIGLLQPDDETVAMEQEVVAGLVRKGATIVSGLAMGCDTVAHTEALRLGGRTVAILPSPLHDILPTANQGLAEEIIASNGLLITEYLAGVGSRRELAGRYQERDRLQALFSDCVVLSASYAKNDQGNDSGSRLAMEYALQYGIPRAAMYEPSVSSGNPRYDLNRALLEQDPDMIRVGKSDMHDAIKAILTVRGMAEDEVVGQPDLFA